MRFSYAHKLSTYLMVGCAYFAQVLSGELSEIAVLLSLIGIIASWFWEPPRIRFDRYTRAWNVVSAIVFTYAVVSVVLGGDLLITGAQFLLYLLVAKLFSRRACKDYLQVYVLTFLMLVSGTALNSEFTYGLFFLGYVISSTWALILFHLRREMEDNFLLKHSDDVSSERVQVARILNSRRIVGRQFFLGTSLVSVTIFVFASMLFLLIPRIGFGLFFSKNRPGITMAGFSDGVQLGGHGVIKTDDTVVMRVKVSSDYEGRRAPSIHWRGVAFDEYTHGEWKRSPGAPLTATQVELDNATTRHHLLYDQAPPARPETLSERADGAMRQEIYLEPLGYDVLFGAAMPVTYEFLTEWKTRVKSKRNRNDEIRHPHSAGIKYVVYSEPMAPDPARLRAAPRQLPPGYEAYLTLPPEVTDEVRVLAAEITAGATNDYDRAIAIESWLKSNLQYTLRMESPGTREPIDFFLFERKAGHCEYFSSAMAVMLRSLGAPTRNVNGFLGGEWNEYDNYIAVRAGDAHSWVEVYFSGLGWVTFDPTPSGDIDQLGRGDGGVLDKLRRLADSLRFKWFKWVIEYDLYRQLKLFRELGDSLRGGPGGFFKGTLSSAKSWTARNKKSIAAAVAIAALLLVSAALWRRRLPANVAKRQMRRRARRPIAQIYRRVLTTLARRGYRRAPSTTPRELAANLLARKVPGAAALTELSEIYYRDEYGSPSAEGPIERARVLSREIEQALRTAAKHNG